LILGIVVALVLVSTGVTTATIAYAGTEGTAVLGGPRLDYSSFDVLPGSLVSLHWSRGTGTQSASDVHFLVTSDIPGFSSASLVKWPPDTTPSPSWNGTDWTTTAEGIALAIPRSTSTGTVYTVSISTCESADCSPPKSVVLTVPPSPTTWSTRSYESDYSHLASFSAPGQPFATTFLSSDNSIWTNAEFSHGVTKIKDNGTSARGIPVVTPKGASPLFRAPFANCQTTPCSPWDISALGEELITADGKIWMTFGGWRWDRTTEPVNHSEVVAFDPVTNKFCTYLVPGNNNEVEGIAATGTGTDLRIWFVESRGSTGVPPSLDGFDPSAIGSGCDGHANEAYLLPESVRLLTWPTTGGQWPSQIAVDPTSPTLWITDFDGYRVDGAGYSDIAQVSISDAAKPTFKNRYVIPSANQASGLGPTPWDIAAPPDSNYVYVIDNGDAEIDRIDRVTKQIDRLAIPLTSDTETAFGLAISSGRLFFSLADDSVFNFDAASTFGYVDLSSWPTGSSHADGVIYSGLPTVTSPGTKADYRGIAVGPTGQVAITDKHGVIRLTPG
jgi:hypothetical protein